MFVQYREKKISYTVRNVFFKKRCGMMKIGFNRKIEEIHFITTIRTN